MKLPTMNELDEFEMRDFYRKCGISEDVTNAAVNLRRSQAAPLHNESPAQPTSKAGNPNSTRE